MPVKIKRVQSDDKDLMQVQQNTASAIEPLFLTTSGSFLATVSGCTTTPIGLAKWQMAASTGQVTLSFPALTGTATTTSVSSVIQQLPQQIWPVSAQTVLMIIVNNGAAAVLPATVLPTGTITLNANFAANGSTSFTVSAVKGINACSVTYQVAL